jgi:HAD superfamily phosphoserine phosphatase-like hydrolase
MKLAIFDFDGTILNHDTLPGLGEAWQKSRRSRTSYYLAWGRMGPILLAYRRGRISRLTMKQRMMENFIILFRGMHQAEMQEFFAEAYDYLSGFFNPLVLREIEAAHDENYHTILLSGAFQELMEVVAEKLGFDAVIGSRVGYDSSGVIDLKHPVDCVIGEDKYARLTEHLGVQPIDWEHSISYADSYTDISVLEPVGQAILVNPDAQLLAWGQERNCRIISGGTGTL